MSEHFLHSSYREKLIEHLFIGELLKISWLNKDYSLEVCKPEVDNSGYDVIAEMNGIVRHIQLKTSYLNSSTSSQKVNMALSRKLSGCVIWIYFDEKTLELGPFYFFGSNSGKPLPDINGFEVAKHTKGNAEGIKLERPNIRIIRKGSFMKFDSILDLYKKLFF